MVEDVVLGDRRRGLMGEAAWKGVMEDGETTVVSVGRWVAELESVVAARIMRRQLRVLNVIGSQIAVAVAGVSGADGCMVGDAVLYEEI